MANGIAVFLEFHGKRLTEQSAELLAFAVACQEPQQPVIALAADGQKAQWQIWQNHI